MTTPTAPGGRKTAAAAALVRAMLVDDRAAGMLIIDQNGGAQLGEAGRELTGLLIDTVDLAQMILLKATGYNVGKALTAMDTWMAQLAERETR